MGYYTTYTLTVDSREKDTPLSPDFLADLKDKLPFLNQESCDTFSCYEKWYYHGLDLRLLSRKYPSYFFTLYGEGDNSEDLWYAYYQDGKAQFCPAVITFDDYDPAKMEYSPFSAAELDRILYEEREKEGTS